VDKTSKGSPYYFIHAKDSDPALVKYLELQNAWLISNGMKPLEKNSKSGLYPYYSTGKEVEFRNFGNNGFIELVNREGLEMFLPDKTNIKRIHSDADDIMSTIPVDELEPNSMKWRVERGKLIQELIDERTGKRYEYPVSKGVSAPVADDNLDMEDFSS
jgi:hypothetical protein